MAPTGSICLGMALGNMSITLSNAACWNCENCECDNFIRLELKEFGSFAERQYYAKEQGVDVSEIKSGDYVVIPSVVVCFNCGREENVDGYFSSTT